MPVATSIVMDVVSFAWSRAVSLRVGALKHTSIQCTHKNGCANEATTGLTLGLFVMLFQDVVFG
jgi:hypothetical protein